jgi:25S rRNA (adenine2142-N1)-methyltransferase
MVFAKSSQFLPFTFLASLLEVGALKPDNYHTCSSWIEWTPIDLHSLHPHIVEQDFLLMDADQHANKWDAISLSLVLNFVPLPLDRGKDTNIY